MCRPKVPGENDLAGIHATNALVPVDARLIRLAVKAKEPGACSIYGFALRRVSIVGQVMKKEILDENSDSPLARYIVRSEEGSNVSVLVVQYLHRKGDAATYRCENGAHNAAFIDGQPCTRLGVNQCLHIVGTIHFPELEGVSLPGEDPYAAPTS